MKLPFTLNTFNSEASAVILLFSIIKIVQFTVALHLALPYTLLHCRFHICACITVYIVMLNHIFSRDRSESDVKHYMILFICLVSILLFREPGHGQIHYI